MTRQLKKIRKFEIDMKNPPTMEQKITTNKVLVSSLYIYTGTPPLGYGTQAPKVAESVNRAYSYNRKKEDKTITIDDNNIELLSSIVTFHFIITSVVTFPFNEIYGNYIPAAVKGMAINSSKNITLKLAKQPMSQ